MIFIWTVAEGANLNSNSVSTRVVDYLVLILAQTRPSYK